MRIRLRRVEPVLRRALRGPCGIPRGSKLLVAVSGGADSTALLAGLASVAHEFALELHAAHLHHGLRGADADADRRFVREACERLGVSVTDARWDTRRRMASRGWSGQDGLRRLRRDFLARAARQAGAAAIATAHTADDQLETLLLRLGRGAGLRGLGGMRARNGHWIKPLLEATRADIESDLRRAGWSWREDESNRSRDYARNRIRHDVIPALAAAVAPGGKTSAKPAEGRAGLARRAVAAAREVRAAEHALAAWVRRGLSRASRIQGGVLQLDSRGVAPYPPAARRMAFRLLWKQLGASEEGLTNRHLDALARLVESRRPGAEVRLPGGWRAERSRDTVRFQPARRSAAPVGRPPRWSDSRPQSRRTTES